MTAAHWFGRLSPSPLTATPSAPLEVQLPLVAVCTLVHAAGRQAILASTLLLLPLLTRINGHHRATWWRAATPPIHPRTAASPHHPGKRRIFHPGATSPPSRLIAPSSPVHATCCLDVSHGARHAPITTRARARSVAPAPAPPPTNPRCVSRTFCAQTPPCPPPCSVTPARTSRTPVPALTRRAPPPCTRGRTLRASHASATPCARRIFPPRRQLTTRGGRKSRWHVAATACSSAPSCATV